MTAEQARSFEIIHQAAILRAEGVSWEDAAERLDCLVDLLQCFPVKMEQNWEL